MEIRDLRRLMPALARRCYLDAAAASPLPEPVAQAGQRHLEELCQDGDVGFLHWLERREAIRAHVARFIGAAGAQEVAFTPSTSMGFHAVGHVLRARGVREVVTLAHEFPASTLPLLNQGVRLRVVPARPDGTFLAEDVEAAIGPETGAIVASQVQYQSGFRLDVAAVGRLARARGVLFALNATQALGQQRVDVGEAQCDFLCGTSHKWLMGGFGNGLFWARAGLLENVSLPWAGWLSAREPMRMDNLVGARTWKDGDVTVAEGLEVRHDALALEAGAGSFAQVFGLGAALELIEQVGLPAIEAQVQRLQAQLRAGLRARGFTPNAPDAPSQGSGICVVAVEGEPLAAVRALLREGVKLTPRGPGIRISTHGYNTEEDVERLLHALDRLGIRPG